MPRFLRTLVVAGLFLAWCLLGLPGAQGADTGMLRLAHLSPDTPAVDVSVDSVSDPSADVTLPGVAYGTVSPYRTLPAGIYTVSMRKAGAPADSPPVLSTTVQIAPGSARTVAGVGHFADVGLRVLDDDLTPPPAGQARMRIVGAAATAPTLDVTLPGGQPVAHGLSFGQAGGYVDVPAGRTTLSVTPAGAAATALPVDVAAGSVYTVLVLDGSGGGLTVRPVLDAAGTEVVPQGAVPAGEGGTAGSRRPAPVGVAAAVAVLATAGLLLTVRRGPRRRAGRARHAADG